MRIILKTVLKNIFGKPLRSLLVIFAIFVCTMAALFCFDMGKTEKILITDLIGDVFGEADFCITMSSVADPDKLPDGLPEYEVTVLRSFHETIYNDIEGEYSVVSTDNLTVYGINIEQGYKMNIVKVSELGDDEIALTDKFSDKYGYSVGDTISIHDKSGEPHDFTVASIVHSDGRSFIRENAGIVNENAADMLSMGMPVSGLLFIDIADDEKLTEAEELLKATFDPDNVESCILDEDTQANINELLGLLFVLFAIAFLLVIFITFSICDRIVSDRMSFIGTLRSLGLTNGQTACILLSENAAYGLFGSIPGVLLYMSVRGPMYDSMFSSEIVEITYPEMSIGLLLGVILGALLVECLIPLKSVLKALKISIRDIIFDNRDTEYKFSRSSIIIGIVMAVIAIVSFFGKGMISAGLCLMTSVSALALLFPLLHRGVLMLMYRIAEKAENEKSCLAIKEAMTRKSTVGSGIICATSSAMCIIIYIIATSIAGVNSNDVYNCDTVVTCSGLAKYYSFVPYLDDVNDTEFVYQTMGYGYINDVKTLKIVNVYGYPEGGFKYYNGLHDMPDKVEDGTICVEKEWAERNGLGIGDTFNIVFDPNGVFPIEKEFTIASFYKIDAAQSLKNDFVISEHDYKSIYHDSPGYMLIKTDDPEGTRDAIKKYAVGHYSDVMTTEEIAEKNKEDGESSKKVLDTVVAVALGMTFIGMVSNQMLGFEGRKKECAVLISTSMTKSRLSGILIREMLYTSVISVTAGTVIGVMLFNIIKNAINSSDTMVLPVSLDIKLVAFLWIMMILVFTISVLFPIRNMRKMKLAATLKYE